MEVDVGTGRGASSGPAAGLPRHAGDSTVPGVKEQDGGGREGAEFIARSTSSTP